MIEFSIYNPEKNTRLLLIAFTGGILVILYYLFPSIHRSIFAVLFVIFILYFIFTNKEDKPVGKMYLTKHQIKIKSKENDFQIDLNNIEKLELTYSGYTGQRLRGDVVGPFNTFSGFDNYLKIVKNNSEFKCRFLVENANQETDLLLLIEEWELLGYDTSNIKINK